MTNQTILTFLNYLSNEARNSVQASLGLMRLRASPVPNAAWQICLENSKPSADRLLRSIDDIRELLSETRPADSSLELAQEFDVMLALGETIELLNLTSGASASRIVFETREASITGRQQRTVEQTFGRILDSVSKLGRKGEVRVTAGPAAGGIRLEITPTHTDIASRVAGWLNADCDQVNFEESDDLLPGLSTLVAGKRLKVLGGRAEFSSGALVIFVPWRPETIGDYQPEQPQQDQSGLSVLVVDDSDESFLLTGILLQGEVVWRARNGLEALNMMKERRFDVVLMDIHMPGLDGYKTIRAVRDWETQTGNARTPIMILSADDLDTQMRGTIKGSCSGFLRKPLDDYSLVDLLDRLKATRTLPG